MTPVNTYVGVAAASCFGGAYALQANPTLSMILVVVGVAAVVTGGVIALYFATRDPDRLHTEDHLLTVRQFELLAEKGGSIKISPVDLVAVAHPHVAQQPHLPPVPGASAGPRAVSAGRPEGEESADG